MSWTQHSGFGASGLTLVEISIVLGLLGLLAAIAFPAHSAIDHWSLSRAAAVTERQLASVRLRAVAHRQQHRVQVVSPGTIETLDAAGNVVGRLEVAGPNGGLVDSVRLRPRTLRYNSRGQGSAGSVYLYRGGRGIRVVSNFLGRTRRHSFRP